jgi:hypothetical protein
MDMLRHHAEHPPLIRRRWKLLVIAATSLVILLLSLYRSGMFTARSAQAAAERERREFRERGQAAFRRLAVLPLADAAGPEQVRAALPRPDVSPDPGQAPERTASDTRALLDQAAELVWYRFGQKSVDEYKKWRRDRGYRLADAITMRSAAIEYDYQQLFGEPYPGDAHLEAVFDRLWTEGIAMHDGNVRLTGVARESPGVAVAFGEVANNGLGSWPTLSGEFGSDVWNGKWGGNFRVWWTGPDEGLRSYVRTHPRTRVAVVGVVVQFAAGDRYPIRIMFYQDAADRRWYITHVGFLNVAPDRLSALLEF